MRYADFDGSASGTLVPTLDGERAFVPNPLPPAFDLAGVALDLASATASIGELRGACRRLANPYILIRPLQRLEAQTSSAMEGTYTTADELVLEEAGVRRRGDDATLEVLNYITALSEAVHSLDSEPITHRMLKRAHRTLLHRVGLHRGEDKRPGDYKRDQNMIGGRNLKEARFIPPPPSRTEECMSDLEKYINRPDKSGSSPLIDMALVHYQFETVHPFADGNGRVGRMLISLMALSERLLAVPALYLSPELEVRKDEYIDTMYRVSATGSWEAWLIFFFDVVRTSCARTIATIDRIIELNSEYRARVTRAHRSTNMLAITDMLFESPVVRASDITTRLGISDAAARKLLRNLCGLGILREFGSLYPTVWMATDVIAVSRPSSAAASPVAI